MIRVDDDIEQSVGQGTVLLTRIEQRRGKFQSAVRIVVLTQTFRFEPEEVVIEPGSFTD